MAINLLILEAMQIVLSSFVIFLLMTGIVEFIFWAFKIKNPRIRSFYRLIPILKLPLEVIYIREAFFFDVNAFSCKSYFKSLIIPLFTTPEQLESMELSFTQYLALEMPSYLIFVMGATLAIIIFIMFLRFINLAISFYSLHNILHQSEPCKRKISNLLLLKKLKGKKIFVSDIITVPIALFSKTIIFPQCLLEELSQEEFESIIAHEVEHLHWYDPLIKVIGTCISFIFCWIPTTWWLKKIENEQEFACDLSIYKYSFNNHSFARAIYKVANKQYTLKTIACMFTATHLSTIQRVRAVLLGCKSMRSIYMASYIGLTIFLLLSLLIGFKIC